MINTIIFPDHIQTWKHNNAVNLDTMRQIIMVHPHTVVDFGSGDGFYGKLSKFLFPKCFTTSVEVEKTYPDKFNTWDIYEKNAVKPRTLVRGYKAQKLINYNTYKADAIRC